MHILNSNIKYISSYGSLYLPVSSQETENIPVTLKDRIFNKRIVHWTFRKWTGESKDLLLSWSSCCWAGRRGPMELPPDSEEEHQLMALVSQEGAVMLNLQVLERLLAGLSCGYLRKLLGWHLTGTGRQQRERGRKWKRPFQSPSHTSFLKTLKGDQMAKEKCNFQGLGPSVTKQPVEWWNQS